MTGRSPRSVTVAEVACALDSLAPPVLAQAWDNVGLLVGDGRAPCRCVLLCIDLTPPVLDEAIARKSDLVLAYHPPLLHPIKRLRGEGGGTDAVVHRAIQCGIAIYSPHTALDAAPGGTNDVIAGLCSLSELEPFDYVSPPATQSKVVTFVPQAQLERVASAMFAAGAGRIGDYEQCSFRVHGEGTFFGTESTAPRVGQRGRLENVAETRLEMVALNRFLPEVIDALLRSHPYEEPAYDVYPLTPTPSFGIGRVGRLPPRTTLGALARKLRRAVRSSVLMMVGPRGRRIHRAAVCVGAAGRLPLDLPRAADCDVIITGEVRHHDALAFLAAGKTALALGHWQSERPVLPVLARRLTRLVRGLRVAVSRRDAPPLTPL